MTEIKTDCKHLMTFNNMDIREEKITGMISMTDMWKATGSNKNQSPYEWLRLPGTKDFIKTLKKHIPGLPRNLTKSKGRLGTYAHWQVSLAYATKPAG